MPITATLSSAAPAKVAADVLAVPVFSGRVLGPGGKALDAATGGSLEAFMTEAGFEGEAGETLAVPARQPRGQGGPPAGPRGKKNGSGPPRPRGPRGPPRRRPPGPA